MLAILAWLAVPLLGVALVGVCRGAWAAYRRSRVDALSGVDAHRRFSAALERDRRAVSRR